MWQIYTCPLELDCLHRDVFSPQEPTIPGNRGDRGVTRLCSHFPPKVWSGADFAAKLLMSRILIDY